MIIRKKQEFLQFFAVLSFFSVLLTSCSLFQQNPIAATLLTAKTTYEVSVKTVGQLYLAGQIDKQQLVLFEKEANKVYFSYVLLEAAYATNQLTKDDNRLNEILVSVSGLKSLVEAFIRHSQGL